MTDLMMGVTDGKVDFQTADPSPLFFRNGRLTVGWSDRVLGGSSGGGPSVYKNGAADFGAFRRGGKGGGLRSSSGPSGWYDEEDAGVVGGDFDDSLKKTCKPIVLESKFAETFS
jgi:hypothetical protein